MLKSSLFFLLLFALTSFVQAAEIEVNAKAPSYHNSRFGFSLSWPAGNYTVFEADNGDGITVTDGQGLTMQAYAELEPRVESVSREEFFSKAMSRKDASLRRINREQGWYAISYKEGDTIIYTKQFYHEDHWPTLHFEYPQALKKQYDPLVKQAVNSFKPF